ncbi:23S rRNA (pseudouridine(1915)-N(3))-methyltransferase RlmH [Murimonas intestini]|uniref:Ribosomal RNA large subunit methyltransferase H n=1 Tax=Murimonas intestini TaxID=1337051 RepID=A0AB73TA04_9FIRM|nr:23S rRNA (pseudouridine(1915)-N(3))-methyltransferase RlmH [Murimonas intestini]MCR1839104.1 23S rRNA (pseudouridine(1915)-N(3))-methyltransferase RlmH [Murimonas intestini]MCR1864400.1 23S rRNA (pseudouridine(1915)-N(3))-methyltransferase RlmH [Murimonas intestini]MCR1882010.1 23S rRNA (pseudouridine(1915)-N(3))-methyltransferase RlmH [Murimonas intestini]
MRISVIAVGRIKEKYLTEAIKEYSKRLGRYCRLDITELADEKTPDKASPLEAEQIKAREGERILKSIRDNSYVIALAIQGQKMTSEKFAEMVEKLGVNGESHLTFVIGGSLGLHGDVLKRAACLLSFSDMTFPHQLMRVILLEQIYRAYRINSNEPYHK